MARELTGERGTVRTVANCLRTLGYVHERLGRYRQALAWYWQAGVTAETAGDRYAEAQILVGLASASRALGRTGAAVRYVTRALAVTRRNGYRAVEGQALTVLAAIHLDREEPAAAIREAERALVIHRDGGYRLGLAHTHRILGTAGAGAEHLRSAAELFAELGVPDTAGLPDPAGREAASLPEPAGREAASLPDPAGREAASLPEPAGREAAGQLPVNGLVSGRRPG